MVLTRIISPDTGTLGRPDVDFGGESLSKPLVASILHLRDRNRKRAEMAGSEPPSGVIEASEAIALLPALRLGWLLRARRQEAHVEAEHAARAAGIEISALDEIESGRLAPEATVLAALLECYGVSPGEFVPRRLLLASPDAAGGEALRGYVAAVRKWRKAGRKEKLDFRESDVLLLSEVLGTDPGEIERRLVAITGCSRVEARLLRKWLLAALVTIPVASGLVGGLASTAAAATPAPPPSAQSAASATTVMHGTLRPGPLSLDVAAPKLGAVRADGSTPITVSYVITDARGSGEGWTVQAAFTSADATAYPTFESLRNVNGEPNLPQTPALPASLGSAPAAIAHAAPGTEGMGSFAGQLELSVIGQGAHSPGQLTLTFAAPAAP
jgi:transcriptional regulator with XRE-family HTH domain